MNNRYKLGVVLFPTYSQLVKGLRETLSRKTSISTYHRE